METIRNSAPAPDAGLLGRLAIGAASGLTALALGLMLLLALQTGAQVLWFGALPAFAAAAFIAGFALRENLIIGTLIRLWRFIRVLSGY